MLKLLPISLLSVALLAGCDNQDPASGPASAPRVVPVETAPAALVRVPAYQPAPATLVAEQQVQVASRLMGHIRAIDVVEGQRVSVGQRLFKVDPVDLQGQVEQSRAAVKQAEDALADASLEYKRFAALYKEEAVTRQQFEKMKLQHNIAESRLRQARAGLDTATGQMRYASVTSPIAGVVTRKLAHAGDLAAPGRPVLVVENSGRLQVETQVPEAVLGGLKPGAQIPVEVEGRESPLSARLARVSPAADPVTRTFLVKLDIDGAGLKSGLFARALFPVGEREVLTVPAAALVNRAGIEGVFVVGADGIARFRMVRAGARQDGAVEVQAGLAAGERVVTGGALERLETGDKAGA